MQTPAFEYRGIKVYKVESNPNLRIRINIPKFLYETDEDHGLLIATTINGIRKLIDQFLNGEIDF